MIENEDDTHPDDESGAPGWTSGSFWPANHTHVLSY